MRTLYLIYVLLLSFLYILISLKWLSLFSLILTLSHYYFHISMAFEHIKCWEWEKYLHIKINWISRIGLTDGAYIRTKDLFCAKFFFLSSHLFYRCKCTRFVWHSDSCGFWTQLYKLFELGVFFNVASLHYIYFWDISRKVESPTIFCDNHVCDRFSNFQQFPINWKLIDSTNNSYEYDHLMAFTSYIFTYFVSINI